MCLLLHARPQALLGDAQRLRLRLYHGMDLFTKEAEASDA
jgi:hypothetical protein